MVSTTLPPAAGIPIVLGFIVLMALLVLASRMMARKMSGWDAIVERFPMAEVHGVGEVYKEPGVAGEISVSRGGFDVRLAAEGVCLAPYFARRNGCLVPWSAIRRVSVSNGSLLVTVDYEPAFQFFLPAETLPVLRGRLSSELFQRAVSPFEAARAVLNSGTQPRWLTALGGRAVSLAEKEVGNERRHSPP